MPATKSSATMQIIKRFTMIRIPPQRGTWG
jgi:hypothetical protein